MQLKSIACYNDVIQTLGRNLHQCCTQIFQSQCFNHNFVAECKQVFTKQNSGKCDKLVKVDDHCINFQGCPVYNVKTLVRPFFTSRIFIGSLILFAILFVASYFIWQRCNQPDTSFEIARTESKTKKKSNSQSGTLSLKKHKHK